MLHTTIKGTDEPLVWRDLGDIRHEIHRLGRGIAAAHERYAALEAARDTIVTYLDDARTKELIQTLFDEAKETLDELDGYGVRLKGLQKELKKTLCLLQKR
ncbi:MAG: hypothetical protein IJC29_01350 [Clostridia bacterium]|nr:hypothetical protein [Clostridia bacterium]